MMEAVEQRRRQSHCTLKNRLTEKNIACSHGS